MYGSFTKHIEKASYLFYFPNNHVCTGFPSAGNDLAAALTMKMMMLIMGMVEKVVVTCTLSYTILGRIITINFNKNLSMTHC